MSIQTTPPHAPPTASESLTGRPVRFTSGPLSGRTVRAELVELQKPNVGRKSFSDRRTIDPPPIVRLRLYDPFETRFTKGEQELRNLTEGDTSGFTCHVDLFHAPQIVSETPQSIPSASSQPYQQSDPPNFAGNSIQPLQVASTSAAPSISRMGSNLRDETDPDTVVAHVNGIPVTLRSRCTGLISGNAVATSSVIEYQNTKQIMFIFSDLAVKDEGDFFLLYRVFSTLFQVAGPTPIPVLAECVGGQFRVYSTKNFPGLRASTDLTKLVSHLGVRVASREHERKRRKSTRGAERPSTPPIPVDATRAPL